MSKPSPSSNEPVDLVIVGAGPVGTSLATIVFTSVSSIRSHNKHGAVRWDLFRPMTAGIVAGAQVGAWTASLGEVMAR